MIETLQYKNAKVNVFLFFFALLK